MYPGPCLRESWTVNDAPQQNQLAAPATCRSSYSAGVLQRVTQAPKKRILSICALPPASASPSALRSLDCRRHWLPLTALLPDIHLLQPLMRPKYRCWDINIACLALFNMRSRSRSSLLSSHIHRVFLLQFVSFRQDLISKSPSLSQDLIFKSHSLARTASP